MPGGGEYVRGGIALHSFVSHSVHWCRSWSDCPVWQWTIPARSPAHGFINLKRLRQIRNYVRQEVATQLVTLLALTTATQFSLAFLREYWRLCNVYKNDCSTCAQSRSTGGRIIPALQQSNWLPIKCRIIIIKIATLLHHILHNCSAVRRTSPTWLRSTRHTRNVS